MQFGRVESELDLSAIDFTLPPDHPATAKVIGKQKGTTEFFVGCAKWGRPDWVGKIIHPKQKRLIFYNTMPDILIVLS
jgi:hypothetical protein